MEKSFHTLPFLGACFIYLVFLYLYLFGFLTGSAFAFLLLLLALINVVFIFISIKIRPLRRAFIHSAFFTFLLFHYELPTFILDEKESIVVFYQPSEEIVASSGIHILGIGSVELEKGSKIHFYDESDLYEVIVANNFIRYRSKNNGVFEFLRLKVNPLEDMRSSVRLYLKENNPEIDAFLNREDIDGSSAGLALVLSSIANEPEWNNKLSIGVTGAINKNGKVKKVELIKEKIQSATRDGHTHVIVPYGNLKEALKAKEDLNLQIEVFGVKNVEEALEIIKIWNTN
jgi:signal transduction histidine kinase